MLPLLYLSGRADDACPESADDYESWARAYVGECVSLQRPQLNRARDHADDGRHAHVRVRAPWPHASAREHVSR